MSNSRLVYSSGDGDQRKRERKPRQKTGGPPLPRDGVVRIFREQGRRGGKAVTVVRGLPSRDVESVAKDLRRYCSAGGAAKDGAVEIQGDHREKVAARLTKQGYQVKLAGG